MNHLRITIAVADDGLQEILVAWLSDLGYEGFEQQDDALQAYLPETEFDAVALEQVLRPYALAFLTDILPERNWNEEWERNFSPVVVDDFCAVRAHFHTPVKGVEQELIITPKMSFGTGHHATTFMMLQSMRRVDFKGRRVLDFGTGTGVLAILAERLGAGLVLAIDHDDHCIENAMENIRANECLKINVSKLNQVPDNLMFDIVLANINKFVLMRQMRRMAQQTAAGAVILLSGLLHEDAKDIENEAVVCGLSVSGRMAKGNWICLRMEKGEIK